MIAAISEACSPPKFSRSPRIEERGLRVLIPGIDIPGHAQKELHADVGLLQVADVGIQIVRAP